MAACDILTIGAIAFLMGIDSESEVSADLQIGPTSLGAVRIYVRAENVEIPMDFSPEEAEEIALELQAAAGRARSTNSKSKSK